MNIQAIKAAISTKSGVTISSLMMVRQMDQQDNTKQTEWLSHWDNDNRIRVTMHQEVFNKIKENPEMTGLAVKYEEVPETTERKAYKRFVVITPANVEATF